jgi:hypothetical protein
MTVGEPEASIEATYRAIGHFIHEFSRLENMLRHYVAEEAGIKPEHFDALMRHDFALLCTTAFEVLSFSLKEKEHEERLKNIINACRKINDERVRVVHGVWNPARFGGAVYHVPRANLRSRRIYNQAKHLEAQANEAKKLVASLERLLLWDRKGGLPPPSEEA